MSGFIVDFVYNLLPLWAWVLIGVFTLTIIVSALWKWIDWLKKIAGWPGIIGLIGIIGTVLAVFTFRPKEDNPINKNDIVIKKRRPTSRNSNNTTSEYKPPKSLIE